MHGDRRERIGTVLRNSLPPLREMSRRSEAQERARPDRGPNVKDVADASLSFMLGTDPHANRVSGAKEGSLSARMTGLEPATSGVTGRCSNQLSYIPKAWLPTTCGETLGVMRSGMGPLF